MANPKKSSAEGVEAAAVRARELSERIIETAKAGGEASLHT